MNPTNQTPSSADQQGRQMRPDQSASPRNPREEIDEVDRVAEERIEQEIQDNRQGGH